MIRDLQLAIPAQPDTAHSSESAVARATSARQQVNVAYCVYGEGLSSVFHSQVIVPLSRQDDDVNVRIAVHTPLGQLWRKRWRRRLDAVAKRCRSLDVQVDWLASPPTRTPWLFSDVGQLVRWVHRHYGRDDLILHCRNAGMTDLALRTRKRLPKARIIFDCRGVEAAELQQQLEQKTGPAGLTPGMQLRIKAAQAAESRCAREADHLLCVSQAMKDHLINAYGISAERVSVVPCCLDAEPFHDAQSKRDQVRQELGVQDRLVVTYCGSLAWYQHPEQALRIVKLLQEQCDRVHFLAITTQPDQMVREIQTAGLPSETASVVSVAPSDVPRYLAAGDLGLLLRDETLVNRVASPVKFGEYMAAGLPVVISDQLGDYSAAVRDHGLGVVVSLAESDRSLSESLSRVSESEELASGLSRDRCRQFADEHLSWSVHLPRISALYRRLSG